MENILIDKEDMHLLQEIKFYIGRNGYAQNRKKGYLHRLILVPPAGAVVDHINGNKLDNRRANLRVCSQQQNTWNSKGKRELKGIWCRTEGKRNKRWVANIRYQGKKLYLGSYTTAEEAHAAYLEASNKYYGSYSIGSRY